MVLIADLLGWVSEVGRWFGDTFHWVADVTFWIGGAITWIWSVVFPIGEGVRAAVVVTVAGIALSLAVRKLRLRWLARSPRVQVTAFAWTGHEDGDREATWITSLFREQLTSLQLDPLDALPERAPGAPLVEIVESVGQGVSQKVDVGKALGRAWRAVWPDAAYEVWGTLRPLDGRGRISVQVVDHARGNRLLLSEALDEVDWKMVAKAAAMAVAGALYPRVAQRYRGPWTAWNESVPPKLIGAYHRAHEREDRNRLEEAMDAYHEALGCDPLNPDLRLKIAMLQERLGLDLDAWVTYRAIVDETDRSAWKGSERRVRFLALYRLAILLGNGRVAEQWVKDCPLEEPTQTLRDEERWELRRELMITLERDPMLVGDSSPSWGWRRRGLAVASATDLLAKIRDPRQRTPAARREWVRRRFLTVRTADARKGGDSDWDERRLRRLSLQGSDRERRVELRRLERIEDVLLLMSLRRLEELDAWLRVRPPWRDLRAWRLHRPPPRMWLRRRDFSRSAIRVSKRVVRIRLAAADERRLRQAGKSLAPVRAAHRRLFRGWPFPAAGPWRRPFPPEGPLRGLARRLAPRRRWTDWRDDAWQLHYNAACAVASVLIEGSVLRNARRERGKRRPKRVESENDRQNERKAMWPLPGEMTRGDIVRRAIKELEVYAHRAGTDRVARHADWVAFDDPDLIGLAETEEFKLWASHHLPLRLPEERPDRNIDVDRYTARLLHHSALAFAEAWRERAEDGDAPAKTIVTWWQSEKDAWMRLAGLCREHRSWQHRLEAVTALAKWQVVTERSRQIDFGHEPRGHTVASRHIPEGMFGQIAKLAGDGAAPHDSTPPTVLRWAHSRAEHVRLAHETGARKAGDGRLRTREERREALRAARIWRRLAEVLDTELNGNGRRNGDGADPETLLIPVRTALTRPAAPSEKLASMRKTLAGWVAPA